MCSPQPDYETPVGTCPVHCMYTIILYYSTLLSCAALRSYSCWKKEDKAGRQAVFSSSVIVLVNRSHAPLVICPTRARYRPKESKSNESNERRNQSNSQTKSMNRINPINPTNQPTDQSLNQPTDQPINLINKTIKVLLL